MGGPKRSHRASATGLPYGTGPLPVRILNKGWGIPIHVEFWGASVV